MIVWDNCLSGSAVCYREWASVFRGGHLLSPFLSSNKWSITAIMNADGVTADGSCWEDFVDAPMVGQPACYPLGYLPAEPYNPYYGLAEVMYVTPAYEVQPMQGYMNAGYTCDPAAFYDVANGGMYQPNAAYVYGQATYYNTAEGINYQPNTPYYYEAAPTYMGAYYQPFEQGHPAAFSGGAPINPGSEGGNASTNYDASDTSTSTDPSMASSDENADPQGGTVVRSVIKCESHLDANGNITSFRVLTEYSPPLPSCLPPPLVPSTLPPPALVPSLGYYGQH
uniref:YTH domain-containing protein n=1 Tax=Steinernema glaseri TaxID=37863 RepID=A0A1I8ATW7_9BILA